MSTLDILKAARPDFWASSGYAWLAQPGDGTLAVTDDFLRHLLQRPELAPIAQSCAAEAALHERLLAEPRQAVAAQVLQKIRDADAAANYGVWLRFRDRLLAAPSLQAAYLALFQGQGVDVPPALVHELTQILLRHVLHTDAQPMHARAAEMLFRPQKIAIQEDGMVMSADAETVERHAVSGGFGSIGELLAQGGIPLRTAELDVLSGDNADLYWQRSEAFDLVVCLNHGQPALAALCRVLERWVAHFLRVEVTIAPAREINDDDWRWHVGLDAQASAVLNDLYTGKDVDDARMGRLLCLFKLEFADPADMLSELSGSPVYLAMAMDEHQLLKLKPQNLLLNLPLARRS
ncbi:MAG: DUF6352 family protein [Burkholderiaceae bacterium]